MFSAIMAGFMLVILVHSITYGALQAVTDKAARYFSGHISITGYSRTQKFLQSPLKIKERVESSELPIGTVSLRTVYYFSDASLFYNGESIRQRRLIGVDFSSEYNEFATLDFQEGSIDDLLNNESDTGVLISEVAAKLLGARVGDQVLLSLRTFTGQYNTATLTVRGIFRETSLFGYVAYMNRSDMNRLLVRDQDFATDVAVYTVPGSDQTEVLEGLRSLLGEDYDLIDPVQSKDELEQKIRELKNKTPALAILTLDIHLDQIKTIMDAVKIVTWVVQVLFLIIIMVGILNTYRVLVYERTKEIGTLRAMGMTRTEVRVLFLFEAFFLDLGACVSGFILFRVIVKILERVDISKVPGAGLFTERGHLYPHLDLKSLVLTSLLMLAAVLIAAWGPAGRASRLSPVDAMREEN